MSCEDQTPDARETRWSAHMRAALGGDRRAYAELLSAIADRVRAYARARVHRAGAGAEEVEDIVQDVLVAVHTKRDTWEPTRPFGPWVDAIIRYKTVDALRRLGRRQTIVSDTLERVAETVTAPLPARMAELPADMQRHLSVLPRRERSVVTALGIEGMSIAGCAEQFGISEGAVRVAFHRGLARLASGADGDGPPAGRRSARPAG